MAKEHFSRFDEVYMYRGHALLNELYADDEGFYKNGWKWGVVDGSHVYDVVWLEGLSSASYARYPEAYQKFKELVDEKIEAESVRKFQNMLLFS